ncbi:MAG: insulinase family protein [Firmicutes bacterium]|nr:insulinase family protein [Bacillota bacterium]
MEKNSTIPVQTIKHQLPNGIKLLIREDHSMPTVSVTAYFIGGMRTETAENNGITSLVQRLVTRGAGEFDSDKLHQILETWGIKIYSSYGKDLCGLHLKTLSRHFDRGFELFFKVMTEASFAESEFEKEKLNQLDEIHKEKDDVLPYCMEKCEELVFSGHPYALPSNGTIQSVEALTRDAILDYFRRTYCPNSMVIAMVGDISADYALSVLESKFSSFDKCGDLPDPGDVKNPIKNVREGTETNDKQQVAITIGFQAPSVSSEDYYTFSVLNQVLSGMGSRLFVELRDKQGLAYSVSSSYSGFLSSGIFKAYILTAYNHKERARLALLEEVDRLRTRLVSYDELVRAKRFHLGLFEIGLQSNASMASKLAYYEIMGIGSEIIDEYSERVKLITRQKVKRAAEKFLKPQSYAISILTPASFPKILQ